MSHAIELLVVSDRPAGTGASLMDCDRFTVRSCEPEDALAAFEQRRPDCLVTCVEYIPTQLAARASRERCPIVDHSGDEDVTTDTLAARIVAAVDEGTDVERNRITRLHSGSVELVATDDRAQLYQRTVDIASGILNFDIAVVFLRDAEQFRRAATTDETVAETRDSDKGVVSQVFETGEPALVDNIDNHSVAQTERSEYRSGIAVPFGDVGVLVGLAETYAAFDETDLELAELLASHAAQVEARLRAEEDLRDRQATITQLHRAAPQLIDAESETELYERTVEIAKNVLDLDRSVLFTIEEGEYTVAAGRGEDRSKIPPEGSILSMTYEEGRSFLVTDVDDVTEARPTYESTRSGLSVPVGDDAVFQALSSEANAFDDSDLEHAELLAAYAGATLSRIRSEAALRESRRLIERLHTTAMELASAETEQELLDLAVDAAEDVLALDMCKIDIRDGDMLVPIAESGNVPSEAGRPMHISEGIAGKTVRTGESYLFDDIADDADSEPTNASFRSAISVPLGDLGVFQAVATEPAAFDQEDLELAELLMAHTAVSLQRVRAEEDLRTQRDSLDALFENIPGAAVAYEMIDGEPIVRRVNGAFEQTFGYDAETVIDESLDEFIIAQGGDENAETYNERIADGERVQVEVERQTADGPKHFLLQVTPLEVGEESAPGYAIYSDVTEQREREAELRRQNERLDQFASVVSHDLRNPLNVAAGYLDLVRETGNEEHLDRIEDAIERMDALVTDLLALAREGQDVGETESVGLDAVAHEAWSHVATGDASLRVDTDREIDADPERLTELLENLYRNSVEHGSTESRAEAENSVPHAGEAPTVTVGDLTARSGFYVADDGPGIDPDIEPFDTGVTTSDEGTGFGLPIVQSIAEAHGWSVTATESENGGARFEFDIE